MCIAQKGAQLASYVQEDGFVDPAELDRHLTTSEEARDLRTHAADPARQR
jgi:hypothetical protein